MVRIVLIEAGGARHELEGKAGVSLMRVATSRGVPGIDAECGGMCACATCHVYIDPDWTARVGPPTSMEAEMMDVVPDVRPNSRLSCQVTLSAELDGLTAQVPRSQR